MTGKFFACRGNIHDHPNKEDFTLTVIVIQYIRLM